MPTASGGPPRDPFDWPLWPETAARVDRWIALALDGNPFASGLAARMRAGSNTRFNDWVDHLILSDRSGLKAELSTLSYVRRRTDYAAGVPVYVHPGGIFPRVALAGEGGPEVREVAILVDSVAAFS